MNRLADLVIVGGGAAGFFTAIRAKEQGFKGSICILEKSSRCLDKVRISGGGRCNVTHACFKNAELLQAYPRGKKLLKEAFKYWSVQDTIQWFQSKGVPLVIEDDGRMFPQTNTSETIVQTLHNAALEVGVQVILHSGLVRMEENQQGWRILLQDETVWLAKQVVLALGGLHKESHYDFLRKWEVPIVKPVPSLFTYKINDSTLHQLSGLSVAQAKVKRAGEKDWISGAVLITHWGLSGPAILRSSSEWARTLADLGYHFELLVDWSGGGEKEFYEWEKEWKGWKKTWKNSRPHNIPQRLWEYLLWRAEIDPALTYVETSKRWLNKLMEACVRMKFQVSGKSTFKEEFVTAGGIATEAFKTERMELKNMKGVYVCGEMADIDAITGGYNFQAAWATANLVGRAVASVN